MRGELHSENAAVLFVDVCGSTAYFERHGEAAGRERVRLALSTATRAVEEEGGKVLRVTGDALLAVFPDSIALVSAAAETYGQLEAAAAVNPEEERIRLHAGGHFGPVLIDEHGELFGDVANVASRVQDFAGPDQIYITADLVENLGSDQRATTRRIGKFPVRGRKDDVELFEFLWKMDGLTAVRITVPLPEDSILRLCSGDVAVVLDENRRKLGIGRDQRNDLAIEEEGVSRVHAEILRRRAGWALKDKSTNGTYLKPDRRRVQFVHHEEVTIEGEGAFHLGSEDGPRISYEVSRREVPAETLRSRKGR